jgi:putative transposase
VLNAYVFESLDQVREISAEWLQSYNEERPYDALAGLPPATYRSQLGSPKFSLDRVSLTGELTVTPCD